MKIRRCLFLTFLLACCAERLFSQTCPPNIDFESGDFSSWECFSGSTSVVSNKNQMNLTLTGPVAGRHEIISASTAVPLDPYGEFPKLCPYGGNYSVKLGNSGTGAQAEGLSYTFQVPTTVDTFTFTYFYAVVFESPGHTPPEQPRFFVTAYDVATGNLINCASFDYVSSGTIPGFKKSRINNGVLYKEWTPTSLQFAGLSGRTVRLEFKTADCTLSGHFGYAYVDVSSACSNILATAPYCIESNSLILNAPYGFQSYTWYNGNYSAVVGTDQSITMSPPPATNGVFYVDMIPYPGYGCRDTLQAFVTPLSIPDTPRGAPVVVYCQSQSPTPLSVTAAQGHMLLWYNTETGGTGASTAPIPSTSRIGETYYYVSQKALFGCEGNRKKITVKVSPTPNVSFKTNNARQCQNGNQFDFSSTSANLSNAVFSWDFGDGQTLTSAADSVVTHTYNTSGSFVVRLKVTNDGTCSKEQQFTVHVVPKPIASFTHPSVICENQTPLAFVNTSSVPGGVSAINKWWWNINGTIVQTQVPSSATANAGGRLPVQLVVSTAEGCRSDTNKTLINIKYQPIARFKLSAVLCNNELTQFTDLTALPVSATGESVSKWHWVFDNTITHASQHPGLYFVAGNHKAALVAETNFGCRSFPADSLFTVHAKPQVQVSKTDSCVFRNITFSATSVLNNVSAWYWDFGAGPTQGTSVTNKTYVTKGVYPFTLLTQTVHGCQDTVVQPFMIYDNKILAGRDTVVAINEPVQLNANGGVNVTYAWSPATGLNNTSLENPVATLDFDQRYELYAVTDKGCDSRSSLLIKRYAGPTIYIPSAFTPNNNGKNDLLKVVPVGMKLFKYFAVFNRYGEMIFKTTDPAKGWDGRYKGTLLPTATFVVLAEAIDYRGRPFVQKATVTLVR